MKKTTALATLLLLGCTRPLPGAQETHTVNIAAYYDQSAIDEIGPEDIPNKTPENIQSYFETKLTDQITNGNLVLENSLIPNARFNLLFVKKLPVTLPKFQGSLQTGTEILNDLETTIIHPENANIRTIAKKEGANQITVLTGQIPGVAGMADPETTIVEWDAPYFTTIHEIGHNLGCQHDRGELRLSNPVLLNHGYHFGHFIATGTLPQGFEGYTWSDIVSKTLYPSKPQWLGTIMAYANRLPYFSNPNISFTITGIRPAGGIGTPGWLDDIPLPNLTFPLGISDGTPDSGTEEQRLDENHPNYHKYGGADNARVIRENVAQYVKKTSLHTIILDPNGGTFPPNTQTTFKLLIGETIPLPAPTRENYQFIHWLVPVPGGYSYTTQGGAGISSPLEETYLAAWQPTGTTSGTSGGNTGGGNSGGGGGGGGGGAPSIWMLLGLAMLMASQNIHRNCSIRRNASP
jgi:uncharacterized membrane protein YgcG